MKVIYQVIVQVEVETYDLPQVGPSTKPTKIRSVCVNLDGSAGINMAEYHDETGALNAAGVESVHEVLARGMQANLQAAAKINDRLFSKIRRRLMEEFGANFKWPNFRINNEIKPLSHE